MSLARSPQWPGDKAHARNAILRWRKDLTSMQRDALTQKISTRLESRLLAMEQPNSRPPCIGVFWPIRNEPDLRPCYRTLSEHGFDLALPITPASPGPLTFLRWREGDPMHKDAMGIAIPELQHRVVPNVLVIPCVGFGPNHIRLGYGGGYYDRTLADFSGDAIGVAYSHTYLPELQAQQFDVALTEVITEDASGATLS